MLLAIVSNTSETQIKTDVAEQYITNVTVFALLMLREAILDFEIGVGEVLPTFRVRNPT